MKKIISTSKAIEPSNKKNHLHAHSYTHTHTQTHTHTYTHTHKHTFNKQAHTHNNKKTTKRKGEYMIEYNYTQLSHNKQKMK